MPIVAMYSNWIYIELPSFMRAREHCFASDKDYGDFQRFLGELPEAGEVMPGCGGFRKIRWTSGLRNKGKRGGNRIIYLQIPEVKVLLLATVYGKDEKDDLSPAEKKEITQLAVELKKDILIRFSK